MNIINSAYNTQIEVKKSKFLSFIVPIEQFKELHEKLKKEHPKANHIVWAKRELNEFKQIVENSSDDGEPKGAAGVPTLNVLRGNELINSAILTVRYFGGIKLGVGGMARAYSDAANAVVKEAEFLPYIELVSYTIRANYNQQRKIEYNLKELGIKQIKREFLSDRVLYHINTTQDKIDKLTSFTSF